MLEKLSGFKTHFAILLTLVWVVVYVKVPGVREAIGQENFTLILTALAGLAGIALRAGVQKAENAARVGLVFLALCLFSGCSTTTAQAAKVIRMQRILLKNPKPGGVQWEARRARAETRAADWLAENDPDGGAPASE